MRSDPEPAPAEATLGRKDRERLARRRDILHAARKVFARRGYKDATLEEIAEQAEFAKGTLYNYFQSKEDIFREIILLLMEDIEHIAQTAVNAGGDAREVLFRYAREAIDYYKKHEDMLKIAVREMVHVRMENDENHMTHLLKRVNRLESILAGALRKDIRQKKVVHEDPEDLAQIFVTIIHHRSMRWVLQGKNIQTVDSYEEAEFATRLFFEGSSLRQKNAGRTS
jgi:AcrR family transcriptional regulator